MRVKRERLIEVSTLVLVRSRFLVNGTHIEGRVDSQKGDSAFG